jgi:hypothetical protein
MRSSLFDHHREVAQVLLLHVAPVALSAEVSALSGRAAFRSPFCRSFTVLLMLTLVLTDIDDDIGVDGMCISSPDEDKCAFTRDCQCTALEQLMGR